MARIENKSTQSAQRPEPKRIKPKKRRGPLFACLVIVVVATVLLLGAAGWAVAKTGLVRVPLLTNMVYEQPEPTRYVMAGTPLGDYVRADLEKKLTQRLIEGRGTLQDTSITLRLPESSLTATLQTSLNIQDGMLFDIENGQLAAIEEKGLEVFLPITNEQESAVRVLLEPTVTGTNQIDIHATEMWVGGLRVPGFLTSMVLDAMLSQSMSGVNNALQNYANVDSVEVKDGYVEVHGEIKTDAYQIQ